MDAAALREGRELPLELEWPRHSLDAARNPVKPAVVFTIHEGQRRFAAAVTP